MGIKTTGSAVGKRRRWCGDRVVSGCGYWWQFHVVGRRVWRCFGLCRRLASRPAVAGQAAGLVTAHAGETLCRAGAASQLSVGGDGAGTDIYAPALAASARATGRYYPAHQCCRLDTAGASAVVAVD